MKIFSILILLIVSLSSTSQTMVDFTDTTDYKVLTIYDTIDVNHVPFTPYPNTKGLDLNCDGLNDININCFTTPFPNFPSVHNIEVENITGNQLEFAFDTWHLDAFRTGDTVYVDSITEWSSNTRNRLLYFHVLSGADWAGIKSYDSLFVTDMNLLFRLQTNNGFKYGWLHYSGKSWPAQLYIHRLAIDRMICESLSKADPTKLSDINIYPIPSSGELHVSLPEDFPGNLSWTIISPVGDIIDMGTLDTISPFTKINCDNISSGFYIFCLFSNQKLMLSKKIVIR